VQGSVVSLFEELFEDCDCNNIGEDEEISDISKFVGMEINNSSFALLTKS
jgi:hypothetical protein